MSHNGTVGHEARHFQEFTYPFPAGAVLVMHSDGLASRWSLDPYPGLIARDPALLAGVLYRDFQRGRDDVDGFGGRAAEAEDDGHEQGNGQAAPHHGDPPGA